MTITEKSLTAILLTIILSISEINAQVAKNEQYNPNSVRPVRKDDIMFKKALWFRVDCRQKINTPFFASNNEISKLIIDAVKNDLILPYKNDSLRTRMSKAEFMERLKLPNSDNDPQDDMFKELESEIEWGIDESAVVEVDPREEYLPRQLYIFELKEDYIFDNRESRMKHDIQAITIIIPAEQTLVGLDKELGSFSFKELVDKVFKNNEDAIWFNPQNQAKNLNLAHAFDLRLWHGQLVKYENPRNSMIVDLYKGGKRALVESERAIMELMEYEAYLWEY